MLTLEDFCGKFSGTCFIVGSGTSVAHQNLDFLKNYTTIAVNAGYFRCPNADVFLTDDEDTSNYSFFYDTLKNSKKTKAFLYEWKFRKFGYWKECQEMFGDRLVSFSHRQGYHFTYPYKHNDPVYGLWQARSSAGSCVHCAIVMGFTKIVLLGMDCCYSNGKRHFYELDGFEKPQRRKPFPQRRFVKKIGNVQTDTDLMQVLDYWNGVYDRVKKYAKLYNCSPISVIKNIPKIDIGEFQCTTTKRF